MSDKPNEISSKANLKAVFKKSNFIKPKSKMVAVTTKRKLNFDYVETKKSRKLLFVSENTNKELISEPSREKIYTPKPVKFMDQKLSAPVQNKETIHEILRRLKNDLIEKENSPSKILSKNFKESFKEWEKEGISKTITKVFDKISDLPKKVHWKAILDLAEFAKRENEFTEAATLFKIVTHLQPYAHQGWMEHAKMEEELGNINRCRVLLKRGLKFIPLNENLFLKALKIEEKEGNFNEVRRLIGSLKNNRIEETFKLLLEGILFEGRCGNVKIAQKALKFL